jgi:hypothetical protein
LVKEKGRPLTGNKDYLMYRVKWYNNPKKGLVGDYPIHLDIRDG